MKKTGTVFLIIAILFSFFGCAGKDADGNPQKDYGNLEQAEDEQTEENRHEEDYHNHSDNTASPKIRVKVPVYGPQYREYWIKDKSGKLVISTSDVEEYDQKCLEYWNKGEEITYGSSSKQDIIDYEIYLMTQEEYENSKMYNDPECIVD